MMEKKQTYKSLLRYPGGKSRAINQLFKHVPDSVNTICSPFLGGASFELFLTSKGIEVYGYDAFEPLVNFWRNALDNPNNMVDVVQNNYPISKEEFYSIRKNYEMVDNSTKKAAMFYILNRASFSGSTMSGGMSPNHPRFTQSSIDRLKVFSNDHISVECKDFKDSILSHPQDFLYLDPPYAINSNLYGNKGDMHKTFDHEELFKILNGRDNWVLSYNNSEYVTDLYDEYDIFYPDWKYGMSKDKDSKEVIIVNNG